MINAAGAWAPQICAMVSMSRADHAACGATSTISSARIPLEPLPYLKDVDRLAFRPEGKGYSGGVPTLNEPRGYNFEVDHGYFDEVVWPALAHRFPQFEKTKCKATLPGLYDQNDFDGNPIIGPWDDGGDDGCANFYLAAGFSGHGLMHAPACGRALSELLLDGRFETLDLGAAGLAAHRARRALSGAGHHLTMKTQQVDIAVVGAGIVGIACAYSLALSERRPKVALIDPLAPMSLTSAASGENYRNWWPHPVMTASPTTAST